MNAIQQLMVAIISVVLGATSISVFSTLTAQEMSIIFWTAMGFLVWIFMWAGLKSTRKKKRSLRQTTAKTRKRKRGKRRPRGP